MIARNMLAVALACCALVKMETAGAQVLYGSIVGTVEDQSGAVVPKASVPLSNRATGQSREAVADDGGRYNLLNVLQGRYEVKVVATGFRPLLRTDIDVTI